MYSLAMRLETLSRRIPAATAALLVLLAPPTYGQEAPGAAKRGDPVAEFRCSAGHDVQVERGRIGAADSSVVTIKLWCERAGQKNGLYVERTPNGGKVLDGSYRDGRMTGIWTWWQPNGRRGAEVRYVDGNEAGEYVEWDELGQVSERGTYRNGVRIGEWKTFFRGTLTHRGEYAGASKPCGKHSCWNLGGKPMPCISLSGPMYGCKETPAGADCGKCPTQ